MISNLSTTVKNPLKELNALGQSVWLDNISRGLLNSGELKTLIEQDGLRGVTSNPTIFEKAINGSQDYDRDLKRLAEAGKTVEEICETLVVDDIQRATDLFRSVFDETEGMD